MPTQRRVYMRELATLLDRRSHTIRGWERDGILPKKLRPHRDEKGWRFWTESQATMIKEWMTVKNMQPGKGLLGYSPTTSAVQEMMSQLRRPRDIELKRCPHCVHSYKNLSAHIRHVHPEHAAAA